MVNVFDRRGSKTKQKKLSLNAWATTLNVKKHNTYCVGDLCFVTPMHSCYRDS